MGRLRVRLIFASCSGSKTILSAFADAEQSAVPVVRSASVIADNDDVAVADGRRRSGTGYREYAAAVVSTMRNESRGFEREKQDFSVRRREVRGSEEDGANGCDEALVAVKGACRRGDADSSISRLRFRRRWSGEFIDREDSSIDAAIGDEGCDTDDEFLPCNDPKTAS